MSKWLLATILWLLVGVSGAFAQNVTCATRPTGDSSNACASTAFVQNAVPYVQTIIGANLNSSITSMGSVQTEAIILPGTNPTLTANLTIPTNVHVTVSQGSCITQTGSYTLTINGPFSAPISSQVFCGFSKGQITFGPGASQVAYAEWWGAKGGNNLVDSITPINEAIEAHPYVQLLDTQYYGSTPVTMDISGHTLAGLVTNNNATSIISSSPSADIIDMIYPGYVMGNNSTYGNNSVIKDLQASRTVIEPYSSGCPYGVVIKGWLRPYVDDVMSNESCVGFYANSTGTLFLTRDLANRDLSSSSPSTDEFFGYLIDSSNYPLGQLPTANASTHMSDDQTYVPAGQFTVSVGAQFIGQFSDSWAFRLESENVQYGLQIIGNSPASRQESDIDIIQPINDNCTAACILVQNITPYGQVNIDGGYSGPGSAGAIGIKLVNADGTSVSNGHQIIGSASTTTVGVHIETTNYSQINFTCLDCGSPVVMTSSQGVNLSGEVKQTTTTVGDAISLTNSLHNNINVIIGATSNSMITNGVHLTDSASQYNEINATTIINGPVTNKININGVVPTTASALNNNIISGVVTGVNSPGQTNVFAAWARLTGGSSPTLLSNFNIASITHTATGTYTFTFTNAMPDANYSVQANCAASTTQQSPTTQVSSILTTGFTVVHYENTALTDCGSPFNASVMR